MSAAEESLTDGLVDFTTVKGIPARKTMVLLNHFLVSSVSYLNHFHHAADQKLATLSRNISRLEVKLAILEAKLKSIDGIETVGKATNADTQAASVESQREQNVGPGAGDVESGNANRDNPKYRKFFKLLDMGMPLGHVKLKAESEGIDPSVFDNPDGHTEMAAITNSPNEGGSDGQSSSPSSSALAIENSPAVATEDGTVSASQDAMVEVVALKDDPRYKRYFKLLNIGVHPGQVKQKMQIDGVDPSILDRDPLSPAGAIEDG